MIKQIKTVAEFDEFVAQNPIVVAHLGFGFNAFDRMMQRNLVELAPEFAGKIAFAWVDVDLNQTIELAARANLVNTPTIIGYQNGAQQFSLVGMLPQDEIRGKINELLAVSE